MISDPITARGMSRPGRSLSPPTCTACSKPTSAKMTPPTLSAAIMPCTPAGNTPPGLEPAKFELLKVVARTTMVRKIVTIFPDGDDPVQPGQEFDPIQVDHRKQDNKSSRHHTP